MQFDFEFSVDDYSLESLDTCLVLELNDIATIDFSPFVMASGDVLNVGDKFTGIDKKGSAGLPPITITSGWYQQYEGSIWISDRAWANYPGDRLARLFSAWEISTGLGALDGFKSKYAHQYMAYTAIDGCLHYWNSCGSSRLVKCKSIERYKELRQPVAA